MTLPLFFRDGEKVYVETPWPRETVFSVEVLDAEDFAHVERDPDGMPCRVYIAVANGFADYSVTAVDEWTDTVRARLVKCRRVARKRGRAPRRHTTMSVGYHSSAGCFGPLVVTDGHVVCERCGWKPVNVDTC